MKIDSEVKLLIDFGMQPVSNRYLRDPLEDEQLFPLKLGQCQITGLIQLINPVNQEELMPRYDWVTYFEPEDHLDGLVARLYKKYVKKAISTVAGISFKDDSTLKRFEKLGSKTWRVDAITDLKLSNNCGVESVQGALNVHKAKKIVNRNGKADFVVVRHIWEHVYNQQEFARALKEMVAEGGYILFEIPDITNLINSMDYTLPWEEHLYCYTPLTFRDSLQKHGFTIVDLDVIPYPYENLIYALVQVGTNDEYESVLTGDIHDELQKGEKYKRGFQNRQKTIYDIVSKVNKTKKIVLFGAGHTSGAFVNHYSLQDCINCIVDDHPNKQGMYMPKSGIPIKNSEALYQNKSTLCLLAVNPIHEKTIISKHKKFLQGGGEFRSICPVSDYSIFDR